MSVTRSPAVVTADSATGGMIVDVESHQGESATGDLMKNAWRRPVSQETLLPWALGPAVRPVEAENRDPHPRAGRHLDASYFIDESAQLLSALRLWAQNQYRLNWPHVFPR